MDKSQLLKKLENLLDEAKRNGQWGSIEIILQCGDAVTIHENKTIKLREGNSHERKNIERR
jgi:hypothetical protein